MQLIYFLYVHRQRFDEALRNLELNFVANILLISMGTDGSHLDNIHGFSAAFYYELGRRAAEYCSRLGIPLVVICEGGYSVDFPEAFMINSSGKFPSPYQVVTDGGINEA